MEQIEVLHAKFFWDSNLEDKKNFLTKLPYFLQ